MPLTSTIIAPALDAIEAEFHVTSDVKGSLTVSLFLLTYCLGQLVLAPFSELLGPIAGGYITDYSTWRWAFHATSIFAGNNPNLTMSITRDRRPSPPPPQETSSPTYPSLQRPHTPHPLRASHKHHHTFHLHIPNPNNPLPPHPPPPPHPAHRPSPLSLLRLHLRPRLPHPLDLPHPMEKPNTTCPPAPAPCTTSPRASATS
ncbi:hypothetical protein ASPFODRAFT_712538 [Aspergillus luchuensis CBS 106.47]|uniref:Major facilitator superfamily (MFS) profile domain-containing protein n=1 Tax=Aspergillus luchuensis (strain CBS 106.47) TaxID=1137211 RepID=A0A1M3TME7_ASPLC|nr:hypothetical protein ASPFODRAFT_712538 [Aspergillus luchuensis CBS 106.47]